MRTPRILLVGLCALMGACAARKPAPLQRYSLGMSRAEYRSYGGEHAALCDTEPRWLVDELSSVNGMLSRFLFSTEEATNPDALQHAEHLALLQQALQSLPPVMEIHRRNLQGLSQCSFQRTGAFPEISKRGAELLSLATARLDEAPAALAAVELRKAQQKWKEEAPMREATAKQSWCTPSPTVGNGDLYFARQHPDGRTEWLFCDGLKVEAPPGGEPQLITPEGLSRRERRRIQPQHYLEAAKAYPSSEIDRQPGPSAAGTSTGRASRGN
ncbi:hypothetical protein [Hyalangium gracile]|uniref:hypothetical protein n=1 Tax=Hyalangium gracile TaxID=394092 RepID=UPI001CCD6234|nr:hypothetical protein [Hyalangium gracile]